MMKLVFRCLLIAAFVATSGGGVCPTGADRNDSGRSEGCERRVYARRHGDPHQRGSRLRAVDGQRRKRALCVPGGAGRQLHGRGDAAGIQDRSRRPTTWSKPNGRPRSTFTLKIGALTDAVQVIGDTPIVDPTTVTQTTRLTRDEFEKLPVGRSYQALMAAAPGVVGTGNANSAGAIDQHQSLRHRRGRHDRPDHRHVRHQHQLRGDSGNVGAHDRRRRRIRPRAGRDRQRRHQVGHEPFRGFGQVHLPQRQLGRAEHDGQRDHRRVARAREVRQGEPGLLLRRRRPDLARTARSSSAPGNCRRTRRRSVRRPARFAEDFQQTTEIEVLEHSRHRAARRGSHGVGEVSPVADRRHRPQRLLGRRPSPATARR